MTCVCRWICVCVCVCPPGLVGTALVASCMGLGSFIALLCLQNNLQTPLESSLWVIGGAAFGITIATLLVLTMFLHSPRSYDKLFGAIIDTDPGKSKSRRRQEKSSSGGL
eukprot:GHVQ01039196.1.p1 GENE.GHVQ01039196.1~~GHVQ01039196.1.p1  ORF type:complete len:110 (+),score=7.97 GHVQ01039196.1:49-378(+)